MLQVRIKIPLLPRHCKLGQVNAISGYLHASVDGQDLREIPVRDASEVIAVVTDHFKGKITTSQLGQEVLGRYSET